MKRPLWSPWTSGRTVRTSSMVVEGIRSGIGATLTARRSGHEAAEPGPVEEERRSAPHLEGHHVAGDQLVVTPLVNGAERALDHGQRAGDDRRSGHAGRPLHAFELVATGDGEAAAE